ncbi:MAG: pyridoxal-dependent decarboxylase [Bacteroidota bacterium]|nr:pyridoxal-dependent decarboxylase [Bacteroidota bacterium]
MERIIKDLEFSARRLEPDIIERKKLLGKVIGYCQEFLNDLPNLPSYHFTEDKGRDINNWPIVDEPGEIDNLLNLIKTNVDSPGLNPASGRHLGYIPGGGIFHSALGDFMADITNRYAGVFFASPGAVRMENMLTNWMASIVGYPETAGGNLTSGGSIANLIGIVTARDAHSIKARDIEKTVVYMTAQAHHSIDKALRIGGLNECIRRLIPLDNSFRMKPEELERAIIKDRNSGLNPWLIVASAGTTDVGAVDPIVEIGQISRKHNLWLHLDAAYGGFFILCPSGKEVLKGLDKSDTIIMDPHKSLFLPYGSGAIIVKDKLKLLESHHYSANYMQDTEASREEFAPGDLSPELSKHFRGLRLWLPLKLLGLRPFRDALEEKIQLSRYFYREISKLSGFELGPFPELSVVTFRYKPKSGDINKFNKALLNEIQKGERVFISSTKLKNKFTLRLAVVSFRTHLDTIDELIEILKEKVAFLTK